MPLGSGNFVQSDSGNTGSSTPTSVDVTLGSPTAGGTVLIGIMSDESPSPPSGFIQDGSVGEPGARHNLYRKQSSTAETTFVVTFPAAALAAWWVAEVTGLDETPFVTGISSFDGSTSAISTGTTAAVSESDTLCIASYGTNNGSSITVTFSGETNSFTEDEDTSNTGPGTSRVAVALAHRFPGAPGSFESTATLSATVAGYALLAVYKATAAPVTVIDDVSVGGTFGITAEVTSRSAGDTYLDLYTDGTTVQGSIVLVSDLSVTGTMNYSTAEIGVTASSVTFTVGDVVQSDTTGECMVVRDAWTDDGPRWSNTTTRATVYTTTGWTVIGSASLS